MTASPRDPITMVISYSKKWVIEHTFDANPRRQDEGNVNGRCFPSSINVKIQPVLRSKRNQGDTYGNDALTTQYIQLSPGLTSERFSNPYCKVHHASEPSAKRV